MPGRSPPRSTNVNSVTVRTACTGSCLWPPQRASLQLAHASIVVSVMTGI
jgi:hypothetical protein